MSSPTRISENGKPVFMVDIKVKKSPRSPRQEIIPKTRSKSRLDKLLTSQPNSYQQKMI